MVGLLFLFAAVGGCGDDAGTDGGGRDAAGADAAGIDGAIDGAAGDAARDGAVDDAGADAAERDAARPDGSAGAGYSLRFRGNGTGDIDRVKIPIDDPESDTPGPPADVGATDFTIELFLRGTRAENDAGPIGCGGYDWINGNIVVDRDRYNQPRSFGLSIADGRIAWGLNTEDGARTICGTTDVLDDAWHHVAVARRRSDGRIWIYVDGVLEAEDDGPDGDLSYPDDGVPGDFCGGPCTGSDPFLVIGAEKHDAGPAYPPFSGYVDEIRLSATLRYGAGFPVPITPFDPDAATAALYHLDDGAGDLVGDALGRSDGIRRFGGSPPGPEWSTETPF